MDISSVPGTDLYIDETVTNQDGTVRDITGASGVIRVATGPNGSAIVSEPAVLTDPTNGQLTYHLPAADTAAYVGEFHVFFFELVLTESDGTVSRLEGGKLTLQ
jgi:hypothetical protein